MELPRPHPRREKPGQGALWAGLGRSGRAGAEEEIRTQSPAAGEQGCGGGVVRKMCRPLRKRGQDGGKATATGG